MSVQDSDTEADWTKEDRPQKALYHASVVESGGRTRARLQPTSRIKNSDDVRLQ